MIYDLLYIRNFENNSPNYLYNLKDKILQKFPYYNDSKSEYFSLKEIDSLIAGFSRDKYENNIYANDKYIIIIVGEIFSRFNSRYFKGLFPIISAKDIYTLFIERGDNFVNEIKGNYQIIIHNKPDKKTYLFNSRSGVSPFYYYLKNNILILTTAIYLIPVEFLESIQYDNSHILEYIIFHYPNFGNTFFENLFNLTPAERIIFSKDNLKRDNYYDLLNHLKESTMDVNEAVETGIELFGKIVKSYVVDKNQFCASFTGGFDSRANLSALRDYKKNILTFAFGIKGSRNISLPMKISKKEGFNFKPYYLEDDFEEKYSDYYEKYIYLTDCLTPLKSPNQLYVFEDLSNYSDLVITGLFGSELIRTFQNASGMIPDYFFNLSNASDKLSELKKIVNGYKLKDYWGTNIFNKQTIDNFYDNFEKQFLNIQYESKNQFFYNYVLKDAFRKYFGAEIHSERLFATNRFPFFDDEFVDFILSSPFSAFNNSYQNPSFGQRIKSQRLYADIIKKYYPELLFYDTDHGYKPADLLSSFPLLRIAPQFIKKNYIPKKKGYTEYRTKKWTGIQIKSEFDKLTKESIINCSKFSLLLSDGTWQNEDIIEIRKLIAFQLYNNFIKK